jgi:hypothetical protein
VLREGYTESTGRTHLSFTDEQRHPLRANLNCYATAAFALLLLGGCGGRTGDNGGAIQTPQGGTSSTGVGDTTGGHWAVGGSSAPASTVGCPGQPVARPAPLNGGRGGDCSGSQGQGSQLLGGIGVNVLESLAISSRCTYQAPACTPLIGFSNLGYLDPNNLSVWFSFPDGTAEMYPGVMSAADCTTSSGGFYLDSINTMPTTITFCPCTCARLGSIQGTIDVIDFPVVIIN